jgi:hypothetical protein
MVLLSVKTVSGKVVQYDFSETSIRVNNLSSRIAKDDAFDRPDVGLQRLICNGKVLKSDDIVEIGENTVVILMVTKVHGKKNTTPISNASTLDNPSTGVENNSGGHSNSNTTTTTIQDNSGEPPIVEIMSASAGVEAPNPFTTPAEVELDEQSVTQLAVTQYMIVKSNPTLTQIIKPEENLMEMIVKSGIESGTLTAGFEAMAENPQAIMMVLLHYLKNVEAGQKLFLELKPLCVRLAKRMETDGVTGLVIDKDTVQNRVLDFDSMTPEQLQEVKASILEGQPELFDELVDMSDEDFKKMMVLQSKAKRIKQELDKLELEDRVAFAQAMQMKLLETMGTHAPSGSTILEDSLTPEDNAKITELATNFGFSESEVRVVYISTGKNVEATVDRLFG